MKSSYNFPVLPVEKEYKKATYIKVRPSDQQRLNKTSEEKPKAVTNIIRYWLEMDKMNADEE